MRAPIRSHNSSLSPLLLPPAEPSPAAVGGGRSALYCAEAAAVALQRRRGRASKPRPLPSMLPSCGAMQHRCRSCGNGWGAGPGTATVVVDFRLILVWMRKSTLRLTAQLPLFAQADLNIGLYGLLTCDARLDKLERTEDPQILTLSMSNPLCKHND